MRIRTLFNRAMAALAMLAALAASFAAQDQFNRGMAARDAERLTAAADALMRATETVVIERANYALRLNASTAADADVLRRLAALHGPTDAALLRAVSATAYVGTGPKAVHAQRLAAIQPRLVALRQAMTGPAGEPLAARDPAMRTLAQATYDEALGIIAAALGDTHTAIVAADGMLGDLVQTARLSWDMREQASRRIVAIGTALNSGRALNAAEVDAIVAADRGVELLWNQVNRLVALVGNRPRLAAAVAEVERRYFADIARRTEALVQAGRAGAAYPMASHEFPAFATPGMQVLLLVRDAALAEATTEAAATTARTSRGLLTVLALLSTVAVMLAGLARLLVHRIVVPVVALTGVVQRLAKGDNTVAVPLQSRGDEIGHMAGAVEVLRRNALDAARVAEEAVAEQRAKAARADATQALVRRFEVEVADVLAAVAGAAAPLDETASRLGHAASGARAQTDAMTRAVDTTASHTETVANSAEELATSIAEVAQQVTESARLAQQAARDAQESNRAVAGLSDVASRIGDVIGLINSIAGQTNLLALNATIEAARAGDAGKGFAVVAGEVKALAAQTATATEQISSQINAMQAETDRAVAAIRDIGKTIDELSTIATQVAAAAEEQSAATQEIGRAIAETAASTQELTAQTAQARQGAETTLAASAGLSDASTGLSRQADVLRAKVDGFLLEIRQAA